MDGLREHYGGGKTGREALNATYGAPEGLWRDFTGRYAVDVKVLAMCAGDKTTTAERVIAALQPPRERPTY